MTIKEHDCVVLTRDLPAEELAAGDVDTVVHIHREGEAYEVEFAPLSGEIVAIATVPATNLSPVSKRDITHVREVHAA